MHTLNFDGGLRGKNITYAIIIKDDNAKIIHQEGGEVKFEETSNIAEYFALHMGLIKSLQLGIKELEVRGDSQLIINQVNEVYRAKNPGMKISLAYIQHIRKQFDKITFKWIKRENNHECDRLGHG